MKSHLAFFLLLLGGGSAVSKQEQEQERTRRQLDFDGGGGGVNDYVNGDVEVLTFVNGDFEDNVLSAKEREEEDEEYWRTVSLSSLLCDQAENDILVWKLY